MMALSLLAWNASADAAAHRYETNLISARSCD
jgi:hypothetical protein